MKTLLAALLIASSTLLATGCGGGGGGGSSSTPAPAPATGTLNVIARIANDPSVSVSGSTVSFYNAGTTETALSNGKSFAIEINNGDALGTQITSDATMTVALYMAGTERARLTSYHSEYNTSLASTLGYRRNFFFNNAQFTLATGESASEVSVKIVNYTPAATVKTISYTTPFTTSTFHATGSTDASGNCSVELPDTAVTAPVGAG